MKEEKTIMCSNCEEELSGKDKVYIDGEGCTYCSRHCLLDSNLEEVTTAQKYIEEDEAWEN